ncbi:hypothetical protein GCM10010520_31420 [Rhizobium viscosum]
MGNDAAEKGGGFTLKGGAEKDRREAVIFDQQFDIQWPVSG